MAELEFTLDNAIPLLTKDFVARQLRAEVENLASHQYDPKIQWLNFLKHRISKFIKLNKNIRIIDADKGGCTIILNMSDYDEKMEDFLNNKKYFEPIDIDPLENMKNMEIYFINKLKENTKVSKLIGIYEPNTLTIAKIYFFLLILEKYRFAILSYDSFLFFRFCFHYLEKYAE